MMKQKIYQYIQEHHMIEPGDRVCVACSGGADSVCLLTVLHMLSAEGKLSCSLMACHLNHMLRGQESDRDEAFVRDYCRELGIPLVAVREDVAGLVSGTGFGRAAGHLPGAGAEHGAGLASGTGFGHAAGHLSGTGAEHAAGLEADPETAHPAGLEADKETAHPAGLEEAGRAARERLYELCVRQHGAAKIALAHHMDDQAETVLFHMARGAALSGLGGIRPVRGVKIRPLLCVRRNEIEAWLTEQGIPWRVDASNQTDIYARNRIRHNILPVLESEINTGAVRHIAEAAETVRLADQWVQEEMQNRIAEYTCWTGPSGSCRISRKLAAESEFVLRTVIMQVLTEQSGTHRDIGLQHVLQVKDLLTGPAGRKQDLPHRITAYADYDGVVLQKTEQKEHMRHLQQGEAAGQRDIARDQKRNVQLTQPGPEPEQRRDHRVLLCDAAAFKTGCLPSADLQAVVEGYHFIGKITEIFPRPIPEKPYTKWINCDKITGSIAIRTRRPGDYILLDAAGRRQSIKAWMINRKIPREMRDRIPLLVHENPDTQQGAEVLWIIGGRISASARVADGTKRVLQLTAEQIPVSHKGAAGEANPGFA